MYGWKHNVKVKPEKPEEETTGVFFPPAIINFAQNPDMPNKKNNPFEDCKSPVDEAAILVYIQSLSVKDKEALKNKADKILQMSTLKMPNPSGYILFKHLYHKILRNKGVDTIALMR